jgi:dihydroorotate dehydrogenase
MPSLLYRLTRPLLFSLDAERAHHLGFGTLRAACALPGGAALVGASWGAAADPALRVDAMGLSFPSPIGLAAGFDKDALGHAALLALGFGFVEIGTITALPQPGNPKPRMFRLPADRALINRLGFNNGGAEVAAARLRGRDRSRGIVGINIGKSKVVEEAEAAADYARSARLLAPLADYLVVNVSSPNTPGLRNLQAVEKLAPILEAVLDASRAGCEAEGKAAPPLLVKIAPDLADEDVDAAAQLASTLGLAGVVATNTTIGRAGLRTDAAEVAAIGAGGLSGAPLKARATEVVRRVRQRLGAARTVIGVGGIETAEDVWERLSAGANLVQLYTGFVYGGPTTPRDLAAGLAARLKREGRALPPAE